MTYGSSSSLPGCAASLLVWSSTVEWLNAGQPKWIRDGQLDKFSHLNQDLIVQAKMSTLENHRLEFDNARRLHNRVELVRTSQHA